MNLVQKGIIFAAIVALIAAFQNFVRETPQLKEVVHSGVHETKAAEPIHLVFVGDIMMDRGVRISVAKYLGGDYHNLFTHASYLKDADVAFANLEGTVGEGGTERASKFFFRMDPAGVSAMRDAGFDVVSFANNHIGDFSQNGFEQSLNYLKQNTLLFAGAGEDYAEATAPKIIEVRGVKIGFLGATDIGSTWMNATEHKAGVLLGNDPNLASLIKDAKSKVDILVMSFHFGTEYSPANKRQETLAHLAIDSGADIVVGHHPHVIQKTEMYKGKPIFYSLGNFIFDQSFSPYTMQGMVADVLIDPKTLTITASEEVSPQDRNFVPQDRIPFDTSRLLVKSFQP